MRRPGRLVSHRYLLLVSTWEANLNRMVLELDGKQDEEDYFIKHPCDTTRRVGSAREPKHADSVAGLVYWEEER